MEKAISRSVLAVGAGWTAFFVGGLTTMATIALFQPDSFRPGARLSVGWWLVTLSVYSVYAAVGGFVTGVVARRDEIKHAVGLVALMLLISVFPMSRHTNGMRAPLWCTIAGLMLTVPSILLGGCLRRKQRILLQQGSAAVTRFTEKARLPAADLVSLGTFLAVIFWGTVSGVTSLDQMLQRSTGVKIRAIVALSALVVTIALAGILSRHVFRRIMKQDTSSIARQGL